MNRGLDSPSSEMETKIWPFEDDNKILCSVKGREFLD